jgi:antitoxin YefM
MSTQISPNQTEVQYVSDATGTTTGVLIPIDLWHEIASERETAYLLRSENMKRRLLDAMKRTQEVSDACQLEGTRE